MGLWKSFISSLNIIKLKIAERRRCCMGTRKHLHCRKLYYIYFSYLMNDHTCFHWTSWSTSICWASPGIRSNFSFLPPLLDVGLKRLGENAGPGTYDQAVVPDFLVLALDDKDVPRNVVPKVEGPPCHIFAQAQGLDTIIRPETSPAPDSSSWVLTILTNMATMASAGDARASASDLQSPWVFETPSFLRILVYWGWPSIKATY